MKRILVLALALILAVSFLAVPSYAAEPMQEVDLLSAMGYDCYRNDVFWQNIITPSAYCNGYTSFKYDWEFISTLVFDRVVFTIDVAKQPDNVVFDRGSFLYDAVLIGSNGTQYQYEVIFSGIARSFRSNAGIEIQYDSDYYGSYSIVSCIGYVDDHISIDQVDYFANAMTRSLDYDEYGQPLDGFLTPISVKSASAASLPFTVSWDGPSTADNVLDYGEVFTKIHFNDFAYLDSMRIQFFTCGEVLEYGVRLEDASGQVVSGLPTELTYCGQTQRIFELTENYERIHFYYIDVDLSGFDLADLTLSFSCNIDKVFSSSVANYEYGFYFSCESVSVFGYDNIVPWYLTFGRWLNTQLGLLNSNTVSVIHGFQTSVTTWFSDLYDRIGWFRSSMEQLLTDIYNALNASGDNDQFQDDVGQQGDKLDDMQDVMDSVTQPALDSIDTDLSGIVGDADLASVANVYTMVIGDSFVPQIMTMVVVMAMMSFALFGKR